MNALSDRRRIILRFLIAAVLCLSAIGCGGKQVESTYGPGAEWIADMREKIQDEIDDPAKVTDLLAVIDKIEDTLIALDQDVQNYYRELQAHDRNYKTTREEFQAMFDRFNTRREIAFDRLIVHLFEVKKIAGREDWARISEMDKTLYENWQRAYKF